MADTVSVHVPIVEMRQEGGKWAGYITTPWFRYLLASNPDGFGTGTGVLHGNESGAPTWGPVDLAADVTGTLPVANGGLGGISATIGGILYFATATQVASSDELLEDHILLGGGAGPPTILAGGSPNSVLHGNSSGAPMWGPIDLTADVENVLPVIHGGTGVSASTGSGAVVLAGAPTLLNAHLSGTTTVAGTMSGGTYNFPTIQNPDIEGGIITSLALANFMWSLSDCNVVSVTAAATTLFGSGVAGFFVVHDKTSGGMAAGLVSSGGVVILGSTIGGINWTVDGTSHLQAAVTGGANPRSLSCFGISIGTA